MSSPLLLLAFSALHFGSAVIALTLNGPAAISTCGTYNFSWDGTPPYTFRPLVGTDAANTLPAAEIGLATPSISYHVQEPVGSVLQVFVVDASGDASNTLNYTVQDSGSSCSTTLTGSTPFPAATTATIGGTTTQLSSVAFSVPSTLTVGVPTPTAGDGTTQTIISTDETSRTTYSTALPSAAPADTTMTLRLSLSTVLTIVATVGGALFLIIGLCCWRWRRARRARKVQRRNQPQELMRNADLNDSGLLLTNSSLARLDGPAPSTPNSGDPTRLAVPLAVNVLPSMKERRMRGAVNREPDLEDGSSISDVSGPFSTAHSTSIWPASSVVSPENSPSRAQFHEPMLRSQQSLQAIIGREIQEMLQSPQPRTSTSFASTQLPPSSLNELQSSDTSGNEPATLNAVAEKPALSLEIPQTNRDPRSILQTATTPISRRDMEVLADLVAQRLINGRVVEASASDHNPEAPPPQYS